MNTNRFHHINVDPLSFKSYGDFVAHYYPLRKLQMSEVPCLSLLPDLINEISRDKQRAQANMAAINYLTECHRAWEAMTSKSARLKAWKMLYEKECHALFPNVELSLLKQQSHVQRELVENGVNLELESNDEDEGVNDE